MKIGKKITVVVLVSVLAVSGVLGLTTKTVQAFSGAGAGLPGDPYIITTCAQLQEMQDGLGSDYKLGNTVNCDVAPYNTGSGFEPVGTDGTPFTGSFDGAGYTIEGLFIDRSGTNNIGLFGYTSSSTISNVGLVNMQVTGDIYTGGLVGYNNGGTVEGSYAKGTVSGNRNVGGLVGYNANSGVVKTSYAAADASSIGSSGDVGGLVGLNDGTIENSYATGDVSGSDANVYAGGLVGLATGGTIQNSYATGNVSVNGAGGSYAGGLAGVNGSTTIQNSYATGTASAVEGDSNDGGLIGDNNIGSITNSYSVGASPVGSGSSTGITGGQSLSSFYQTDPLHAVYTGTPPWDFGNVWYFANASSLPLLDLVEPPINSVVLDNAVNGKPVSISTPSGTNITCSSALTDSSVAIPDSNYSYPEGLVKFCFDTNSSSNQVTLVFVTDLSPGQAVARKYNSVTQTYATITDAAITAITYNGQSALSVTYTIVDNGPLDENPAVGAITDPVGLAVPKVLAPNTGLPRQTMTPFVITMVAGGLLGASCLPAIRRRAYEAFQK